MSTFRHNRVIHMSSLIGKILDRLCCTDVSQGTKWFLQKVSYITLLIYTRGVTLYDADINAVNVACLKKRRFVRQFSVQHGDRAEYSALTNTRSHYTVHTLRISHLLSLYLQIANRLLKNIWTIFMTVWSV